MSESSILWPEWHNIIFSPGSWDLPLLLHPIQYEMVGTDFSVLKVERLPIIPPQLFLPEVLAAQTPSMSLITSVFLFAFYYKTHYTNQLAVTLPAFVFGGEDYRYPWICVQLPNKN